MDNQTIIRELAKYGYTARVTASGLFKIYIPTTGLNVYMNRIEALETLYKLDKGALL